MNWARFPVWVLKLNVLENYGGGGGGGVRGHPGSVSTQI